MKKNFLLSVALLSAMQLAADPITRQQAMQQAKQFLSTQGKTLNQRTGYSAPARTQGKQSNYYIFNAGQEQGYVIVSGDDATAPILGYVDSGTFDYNDAPDNLKAWLDEYDREITWVQQQSAKAATPRKAPATKTTIAPLLTTQWNQNTPFNDLCPIVPGTETTKTVTGCVATAMAQVMNYHAQKKGTSTTYTQATIPAYTCMTNWNSAGQISIDDISSGSPIQWNLMLDSYNSSSADANKAAVAKLMLMCGASVSMEYGPSARGGSAASSADVPVALKKYFGYQDATQIAHRSNYSVDEWNALIYSEVAAQRPVQYSGQSSTSGHSFVIDGYDAEKKMFHVNWGWGGMSDGYFLLSVLTPEAGGIGAGDFGSGYNSLQDALIYAQPKSADDLVVSAKPSIYSLTTDGAKVSIMMRNVNSESVTFQYGIGMLDDAGNVSPLSYYNQDFESYSWCSLEANTRFSSASDFTVTLPDGTTEARIVPCFRLQGETAWQNAWSNSHYLLATNAGGTISLKEMPVNNPDGDLTVANFTATGSMKTYRPVTFSFDVTNSGQQTYAPTYYIYVSKDGAAATQAATTATEVGYGDSRELTMSVIPTEAGSYRAVLCSDEAGTKEVASTTYTIAEGVSSGAKAIITTASVYNALNSYREDNDDATLLPVIGTTLEGSCSVKYLDHIDVCHVIPFIFKYNATSGEWEKHWLSTWTYATAQAADAGASINTSFSFTGLTPGKYKLVVAMGIAYSNYYSLATTYAEAEGFQFLVGTTRDEYTANLMVDNDGTVTNEGSKTIAHVVTPAPDNRQFVEIEGLSEKPRIINITNGLVGADYSVTLPSDSYPHLAATITSATTTASFAPLLTVASDATLTATDGLYNVVLNRSFKQGWNTLALPFALASNDIDTPATPQEMTSVSGSTIYFTPLAGDWTTEASKPYIIYFTAPTAASHLLPAKTVSSTNNDVKINGVAFKANYQAAMPMNGYYGVVNSGSGSKLMKGDATATLPATGAYIDLSASTAKNFTLVTDAEATAISSLQQTTTSADAVYTVGGQRVAANLDALPKGIYIVNGKKVVVK